MAARRTRRKPRYTVDVELQAQDIARLGAALTFRVKRARRCSAPSRSGRAVSAGRGGAGNSSAVRRGAGFSSGWSGREGLRSSR